LSSINEPGFSADDEPNICTSSAYLCLRSLFASIFSMPASSAPIERIFSQSGLIIKPYKARISDNLFETLEYLKCTEFSLVERKPASDFQFRKDWTYLVYVNMFDKMVAAVILENTLLADSGLSW